MREVKNTTERGAGGRRGHTGWALTMDFTSGAGVLLLPLLLLKIILETKDDSFQKPRGAQRAPCKGLLCSFACDAELLGTGEWATRRTVGPEGYWQGQWVGQQGGLQSESAWRTCSQLHPFLRSCVLLPFQ